MNDQPSILIAGAKSDIGDAVARKYASAGYQVILAGRDSTSLERVASDIRIRFDVSVEIQELDILQTSFERFIENLSAIPDVVCLCIGLLGDQEVDERDTESARLVLDTNFVGPAIFLGEVFNLFVGRGSGCIIGISSVAGDRGRKSNYIYGSSKAGLSALLSGMRSRGAAHDVHVLTVKPGYVRTKMTDKMKLPSMLTIEASDLAGLIFNGQLRKRDVIYSSRAWMIIMMIIRILPEWVFKRINF